MQAQIRRGVPLSLMQNVFLAADEKSTSKYSVPTMTTTRGASGITAQSLQRNLPLYHVDRVIRETGERADNGFEEVYVNANVRDGSEVSELMKVFVDDNAYNDRFPITSGSKRRYKETEEGQKVMSEIMERIAKEERNEGRIESETRVNALKQLENIGFLAFYWAKHTNDPSV